MFKKICIVTGATSGIGLEAAKALAMQDYCVVLACRNDIKANKTLDKIIIQSENKDIYYMNLDLSSFQSIKNFTEAFINKFDKLDVLINNAGTFCDRQHTTKEGFELTMGVNYIGAYYLAQLLLPIIKKTPKSRIINVSSIVGLYSNKKENTWDFYNIKHGFRAYNESKLAQIFHTQDLAEQLKDCDTTANSLHPGVIATNIWTGEGLLMKLTKPFMKLLFPSPQKGVGTIIYLATSDEVETISGAMFSNNKKIPYRNASLNENLRKELIELTEKIINEVI